MCPRQDSNLRHLGSKPSALSAELRGRMLSTKATLAARFRQCGPKYIAGMARGARPGYVFGEKVYTEGDINWIYFCVWNKI